MIQNKYQLIVNIKSKGYTGAIPSVTANDNIAFDILVYDGATPFDLTGVSRFTLVSMRKDNISVIREGTLVNGVIEFVLGSSETLENGRVDATVQLYDADNKRVSSAPLVYNVISDPSLNGSLPADDKTLVMANESLLTDAIDKANNADVRISNIVAQAGTDNTEIVDSRQKADGTTYTTLHDRLNASDETVAGKAKQIDLDTTNTNLENVITEVETARGTAQDLNGRITAAETQLAEIDQQKADKDDIFTMANMGQDIKEAMTGGSVAVVGADAVDTVNIKSKAVSEDKTSFIAKSAKRNRIDETTRQDGYRGNTSLGGKIADTNYTLFEKVAIEPNTAYSVWCKNDDPTYYAYIQARYINFYDQSKTYLGSASSLSTWLSTFTSPANAYYADISFNVHGKNFVLVPTAISNDYLPFGALESQNLFADIEQSADPSDGASLVTDSDFTSGYYLNVNNGTVVANSNYKVSNFFPVEVGETYVIDGINSTDLTRTLEGAKNISFFDNGRAFAKTISAGTVYIKEFTVPSPIAFIRFDTNINTNNVRVYKKENADRKEVEGTKHLPSTIKITSDNISPNFMDEIKKAVDDVIASFGDSLTAGTGGGGTSYSSVLESLTGIRVENYGIGGENVPTIASRQGGLVMLVNNITIPATRGTTVDIGTTSLGILCNNGKYVTPLLQGYGTYGGINNCMIAGVLGQIQNNGGVYQFSRYDSGNAVTISRPTPIITDVARRKPYNKMIIWIGQNGGYDSTTDWINIIKQMINFADIKDYIICGLTSGTASSRASDEAAFLAEFGRHYLNLRKYLSTPIYDTDGTTIKSSYGLDDAGLTATAQDITNIQNGSTPISLRMDPNDDTNVHFNASGYTVIGQLIYKRGQELGYW